MRDAPLHCARMREPDPKRVTLLFNQSINARDLESLVARMTDDHRFIDAENHTVRGRDAAREAWRGFFAAFPDYRNEFELLASRNDRVLVLGHSVCSFAALNGPAIWTATIRGDQIVEWRVWADEAAARRAVGLVADRH
jgi:ketosteroid isomerase-like protein